MEPNEDRNATPEPKVAALKAGVLGWDNPRGGLPVGAITVPDRALLAPVKSALKKLGFLKKGLCVTPDHWCPSGSAIHVNHTGTHALMVAYSTDVGLLPSSLAEFLPPQGVCQWVPGLRVRSARCERQAHAAHAAHVAAASSGVDVPDSAAAPPTRKDPTFRFIELFAGIGGFRVGLEALGGEAVFASELDKEAQDTYRANFPHDVPGNKANHLNHIVGDITEIDALDIPDHDILTAGFPCQPFSRAGPARSFEEGARGLLWMEIARVLHIKQPKAFLLENVANLVDVNSGQDFDIILRELTAIGYTVSWRVMNCRALLPQQRLRVYVVGIRQDLNGLTEQGASRRMAWPEIPVLNTILRPLLEPVPPEHTLLTEHQYEKVCQSAAWKEDPQHRLARLDSRARTLMASYISGVALKSEFVSTPGFPRPRFFSPRECARLQGFPEWYNLDVCTRNPRRIYHQIGNAVSPVMVTAIGAAVLDALGIDCSAATVRSLVTLERASCRCRDIVRPALELLLSASPPLNREDLSEQVTKFLSAADPDHADPPFAAAGYGSPEFTPRDAFLVTRLLDEGSSEACRIEGLCTIARAAHYPSVGSGTFVTALKDGLLAVVARQLVDPLASSEVARLAVVTLSNLCERPDTASLVVAVLDDRHQQGMRDLRHSAAEADAGELRFAGQIDKLTKVFQLAT